MGDPVAPLAWLANVLGEQGVALEAGQLILPGSFTKALPVVANSSATADFGDLGSLTIHFTLAPPANLRTSPWQRKPPRSSAPATSAPT